MCYNANIKPKERTKMGAKAIDYSVYNEEALFMELNSTKEQIAELESKKSQIEQALQSIPTGETANALRNSYTVLKTKDYADFEKMLASEDDEQ